MAELDRFFQFIVAEGGSDLHISTGARALLRHHGRMVPIKGGPEWDAATVEKHLLEIMPEINRKEFKETWDTDFAYELEGVGRLRANVFVDHRGPGAVFRLIPTGILSADDLGLPEAVRNLCFLSKGLVVVTGPTGSGKSTTLAAMIDLINRQRQDHIITIEDPIEFVHENKRCLINQRQVHRDTKSFQAALRAALREDPDIVLIGEMRDLETIEIAIETAETGHLVFGTLHTSTAASTVDRLIDQFPADRQQQIRTMLSSSLKGVVAQILLRRADEKGRVAALEVLIVTPGISNNIREGKTYQIPSAMQTGARQGMVLLNDALMDLVTDNVVTAKEAFSRAVDKEGFLVQLKAAGLSLSEPDA